LALGEDSIDDWARLFLRLRCGGFVKEKRQMGPATLFFASKVGISRLPYFIEQSISAQTMSADQNPVV